MNDPVVARMVILALVALSAWLWPLDTARNWALWTRRARRITVAIQVLLMANGYALIVAAYNQVPVRSSTYFLLLAFVLLNAALLFRPANDNTTERYRFTRR